MRCVGWGRVGGRGGTDGGRGGTDQGRSPHPHHIQHELHAEEAMLTLAACLDNR